MKNKLLWFLFFIICVGIGFLHGYLPQGFSGDYIISPTKIRILTTDEILIPPSLRTHIEENLHVKLEVILTRNWDTFLSKTVAVPSEDLIFVPEYWAKTLHQQNLIADLKSAEILNRISPDFVVPKEKKAFFFPLYWMKTGFVSDGKFSDFLKNKSASTLFLIADEDLMQKHYSVWKSQGLSSLVGQKKILTAQLDQLQNPLPEDAAAERPQNELNPSPQMDNQLSALLVWGAAIPINSDKKEIAASILNLLTDPVLQEKIIPQTPFNTTLIQTSNSKLPPQRRADHIRELQLKDTILINQKEKIPAS